MNNAHGRPAATPVSGNPVRRNEEEAVEQEDGKQEYDTLSYLPEIAAGLLRVTILENPERSGIDTLPAWVRFRIEEAARTLEECAVNLEALERYVELVTAAEHEAFGELCAATAKRREEAK
jgi:hypothetical protein